MRYKELKGNNGMERIEVEDGRAGKMGEYLKG